MKRVPIKTPQIRVSFLFLATMTLMLLTDRTGLAAHTLMASLFHECGHIAAFYLVGAPPQSIVFEAFGIRLHMNASRLLSRPQECFVLLAGSGANFLFAGFCLAAGRALGKDPLYPCLVSCILGIFNLLPVSMLDGGKLLRLFLCPQLSERAVGWICGILSGVILTPLAVFGVCLAMGWGGGMPSARGNYTLLLLSAVLLAAIFQQDGS